VHIFIIKDLETDHSHILNASRKQKYAHKLVTHHNRATEFSDISYELDNTKVHNKTIRPYKLKCSFL